MKQSLFSVNRILSDSEWQQLKDWRKANPELQWRRGDNGIDGRAFYKYSRENINGERWLSPEKFARAHAIDKASNDKKRRSDLAAYNSYQRQQRAKNIDRARELSKQAAARYRKRHRLSIREREKEKVDVNRERKRQWRSKNRNKTQRQINEYRRKRPDIAAAADARRRGLKHSIKELPLEEQAKIKALYKFRDILNARHGKVMFHVDHIVPVSKGGKHVFANLRLTTAEYNLRKSNLLA